LKFYGAENRSKQEKYDFLEGYLIFSDENGEMSSWISDGLKRAIREK